MTHLLWRLRYTLFAVNRRMDVRTAWYCSGCCEDWRETAPREAALYEIELGWEG